MEVNSENENEENNVLPFEKPKLAIAGKEPPPNPNWLSEREEGEIFLIKDRTSAEYVLTKFWLAIKEETYCLLITPIQNGTLEVYVEPMRFCQKYSLVEVLGIKEP